MGSRSVLVLVLASLGLVACPKDEDTPLSVSDGSAGDAAGGDAAACLPLDSVRADQCPPTWSAAMAERATFCSGPGAQPDFDAFLSSEPCRRFLRYTRHLFDGGPRSCLYDPETLALRGYRAHDGKALYEAMTCGSVLGDFDDKDCAGTMCPRDAGPLPACTWPASLDPGEAGSRACRAARALLRCQYPNGVTEGCLSNDPMQCPGPSPMPGVAHTCTDDCAPSEYGIVCGGVGPGEIPDPPAACHNMQATPGGIVFYCCPCGS